jgi:hypothetical protein
MPKLAYWIAITTAWFLAAGFGCADTILGIEGTRFTVNGKPTFLLGASYYGALGAPEGFVRKDLADFQRHGFNWLRVWATWRAGDSNVSAVDGQGRPHEPFLGRLQWIVTECDHRGLLLDVTLTRGNNWAPGDLDAHRRAVVTLVEALKAHRNWYLDLANEHDVRDTRYVPNPELQALRETVRAIDPHRLITASFGGDVRESDLREAVVPLAFDFICPHRPREPGSAQKTETQTRLYLALLTQIHRLVPVHYQEPFRRGYGQWEPTAADFLADLKGALAGGAAGWCFHNGQQKGASNQQPKRSFDLRSERLFDQFDPEELKVIAAAKDLVSKEQALKPQPDP